MKSGEKTLQNVKKQSISLGLIAIADWNLTNGSFKLKPNIFLGRYEGSTWESVILNLANDINFNNGQALPYMMFIEARRTNESNNSFRNFFSGRFIEYICSLIGIISGGGSPDLVHIIDLSMGFKYRGFIDSFYNEVRRSHITFVQESMHTDGIRVDINNSTVGFLRKAWKNLSDTISSNTKFDRLNNAIEFYTRAWQSLNEEQALINLCIVLETLFAPHSQSEISHQLALNISKFLYETKDEIQKRKATYKLVKEIYKDRSKIIHGEYPSKTEQFLDNVWNAYKLCANCLNKILPSKQITEIFRNNGKRRDFFHTLQLS